MESDDPWNRQGWPDRQPCSNEGESHVVTGNPYPIHPSRLREPSLGTEQYSAESLVTPDAKL